MAFYVKIEAKLWDDPRFTELVDHIGEKKAIWSLVRAWKIGKSFWMEGERDVPKKIWKKLGLPSELFLYGFALDHGDQIYVKGVREQEEKRQQKMDSGKLGGVKTASKKSNNNNETDRKVLPANVQQSATPCAQASLSSSLSLSLKKEEREKALAPNLKALIDEWKTTLETFGVDTVPFGTDILVARILSKYPDPNAVRLAFIGQRSEKDGEKFSVRSNLSLQRFLDKPGHFEKMQIIAASNESKKTEVNKSDQERLDALAEAMKDGL